MNSCTFFKVFEDPIVAQAYVVLVTQRYTKNKTISTAFYTHLDILGHHPVNTLENKLSVDKMYLTTVTFGSLAWSNSVCEQFLNSTNTDNKYFNKGQSLRLCLYLCDVMLKPVLIFSDI